MKLHFITSVMLISVAASACKSKLYESEPQESMHCESPLNNSSLSKLNINQATGKLNRALMSLNSARANPRYSIDEIDCYLKEQSEFFVRLNNIHPSLEALGRSAKAANTLAEKSAAAKDISQMVSRNAGTRVVTFPNSKDSRIAFNLYTELITKQCGDKASRACGKAADLAEKLWRIAGNYRAFSDALEKSSKQSSNAGSGEK